MCLVSLPLSETVGPGPYAPGEGEGCPRRGARRPLRMPRRGRRRCVIFSDCVRHDAGFAVYGVAVGRVRWPDRYHPAPGGPGNEGSSGALP